MDGADFNQYLYELRPECIARGYISPVRWIDYKRRSWCPAFAQRSVDVIYQFIHPWGWYSLIPFPSSSLPETAIPPEFGITTNANNNDTTGPFVIAMIDLDAPSPQAPTSAQIRHFLGSNFALSNDPNSTSGTLSSSDAVQLLKNSSAALSEFLQPSPPAGSDPHRYVYAVIFCSKFIIISHNRECV